ncbi:Uncharacterized protein Fot_26900 [Forsythia ovata]|uniref:Uncharacterized protein n=1 Tax=Forsythia ovata TaxID=205694 RepID=A0ABD1UD95_9LAMI
MYKDPFVNMLLSNDAKGIVKEFMFSENESVKETSNNGSTEKITVPSATSYEWSNVPGDTLETKMVRDNRCKAAQFQVHLRNSCIGDFSFCNILFNCRGGNLNGVGDLTLGQREFEDVGSSLKCSST